MAASEASLVYGSVFAISAVGLPLLGRLSDLVSRDGVLVTSFAAAVGGYGCFLLVDGVAGILAGTVAIGLGMSWNGVLTSRFMDAFPAADRSAGFGFVRAMFILLGSLGSVVTGILADEFGWPTAYGLVMGLLCVAMVALAVAAVVGRRTKGCRSLPRTTLTCTTQL